MGTQVYFAYGSAPAVRSGGDGRCKNHGLRKIFWKNKNESMYLAGFL